MISAAAVFLIPLEKKGKLCRFFILKKEPAAWAVLPEISVHDHGR